MSPTDAMLIRMADLSGSGGGGGGGSGASTMAGSGGSFGADSGSGSGGVAHAASSVSAQRPRSVRISVVTEADAEYVNLRCAQTTAQHVQFVKVVGRADINAMVIAVVNLDALDV